jgi:hypothetical protein
LNLRLFQTDVKKLVLKIVGATLIGCLATALTNAQPYIDVLNIRYAKSPDAGFFQHNKNATRLNYFNASSTLPLLFHNKKDAIILSPFYEQWSAHISGVDSFQQRHFGLVFPVSLLKSISSAWSLLLTPIVRINDTALNSNSRWQYGGAVLASHKNAGGNFTYKFGVYINVDLFGLFVMPLIGIDWRIGPRTNLFGVLPGNLTMENKLSNHFYWGATFRAITNSYADLDNHYWRVDENQLGLFADCYVSKNIVLNIEAGHSLFRKIRTGIKNESRTDWKANDNVYLKLALAYRMRLK